MAVPPVGDQFYYGRRQVVAYSTTAQPTYHYTPLAPADFLDPQPGDQFVHGPRHDDDVAQLARIFRHVHGYAPFLSVHVQLKVIWDRRDLARPAPDLLVAPALADPRRPRAEFDVAAEGTRPRFVLEVTSPRLAELDLGPKAVVYQQGGVEEYFILDSGQRDVGDTARDSAARDSAARDSTARYRVLGYRLSAGRYEAITPDEAGRLYSQVNGVWIGPNAAGDGFAVIDGRTLRPVDLADTAPQPMAAAESEARQRANAIADQLGELLKGG